MTRWRAAQGRRKGAASRAPHTASLEWGAPRATRQGRGLRAAGCGQRVTRHEPHPSGKAFGGGPQMVEVSRDGERVYFTNSISVSYTHLTLPTTERV